MEAGGGTSGVKSVDVDPKRIELHDTDSSELITSTVRNSMLPQLEATDAKKELKMKKKDEEERRLEKRKEKQEQ
jgi:hypothetical protein